MTCVGNQLSSFNSRKDVVPTLIAYITDDPSMYPTELKARKFPLAAIEIFESGFHALLDEFFVGGSSQYVPTQLQRLLVYVNQRGELNATLSSYFTRLCNKLLEHRPYEVLFL
jgi:hypothetical protein